MFLYEEMMETCAIMDRQTIPDGLGGFTYEWTQGATFRAAVVKNDTLDARVAEKQGVTEVYTVTVDKGVSLDYHDVFKRLRDGAIFRVTSNVRDSETPSRSTFQIGVVSAELWTLTGTEVVKNDEHSTDT